MMAAVAGADVNSQDDEGRPALDWVLTQGVLTQGVEGGRTI